MLDIAADVSAWLTAGRQVVAAMVVETHGSVPRPVGTTMAIASDGCIAGNVSAGCVDAAVVDVAQAVLNGAPAALVRFGISDDDALSLGLTCGGGIRVLVFSVDADDLEAVAALAQDSGEPGALAVAMGGGGRTGALLAVTPVGAVGDLGDEELTRAAAAAVLNVMAQPAPAPRRLDVDAAGQPGTVSLFVTPRVPPPRMLVFGATDYAAALAHVGSFMGYRITVCDARRPFARPERFPAAADVVVQWPHRFLAECAVDVATVICVMTHDEKFDVPLLAAALRSPAGYIGMLGSRRTAAQRLDALREQGFSEADLGRVRTPAGLHLGGRTPEETAVAIAGEIVATRHGGSGAPLRELTGAIHSQLVS